MNTRTTGSTPIPRTDGPFACLIRTHDGHRSPTRYWPTPKCDWIQSEKRSGPASWNLRLWSAVSNTLPPLPTGPGNRRPCGSYCTKPPPGSPETETQPIPPTEETLCPAPVLPGFARTDPGSSFSCSTVLRWNTEPSCRSTTGLPNRSTNSSLWATSAPWARSSESELTSKPGPVPTR